MAETLVFSTGSLIFSGSLHSTASISQLDVDGVTGSFIGQLEASGTLTGSLIGSASHAVNAATASLVEPAPTAESASFATTASFLTGPIHNLVINDDLDVLGATNVEALTADGLFRANLTSLFVGITDFVADVEIRNNAGLRVGHTSFITATGPTPGNGTQHEFQYLGTATKDSAVLIGAFNNFTPHLCFIKSAGASINSYTILANNADVGGIIWGVSDGNDGETHGASILAKVDNGIRAANRIPTELLFSVAPGVADDDITEVLRLRADGTVEIPGNLNLSGVVTEDLVLKINSNLIVGHTGSLDIAEEAFQTQLLGGTLDQTTGMVIGAWGITGVPSIRMFKSRFPSIAAAQYSAVLSPDPLGFWRWYGDDGTDAETHAAEIRCLVDNTVATGIVPGSLLFKTALSGTLATVLTLDSAGDAAFTGDIAIAATARALFDGLTGHTYITETANDRLEFFVSGSKALELNNPNKLVLLAANFDLAVRDTQLVLFDGSGGHTHIAEAADDQLDITVGGVLMMTLDQDAAVPTITFGSTTDLHCQNTVGIGRGPGAIQLDVEQDDSNVAVCQLIHTEATAGNIGPTLLLAFPNASPNNTTKFFLSTQDGTETKQFLYSDGSYGSRPNTYGSISDLSIKTAVEDVDVNAPGGSWDDFLAFRFRKFKLKDDVARLGDDAVLMLGVISQEVQAISPGLVTPATYRILADGREDPNKKLMMAYSIMYMKGMTVIQELQKRVLALEAAAVSGSVS